MGFRKMFAPAIFEVLVRRRVSVSSIEPRCLSGFSEMNMFAELRAPKPPPPMKPVTFSTAGSAMMMSITSVSLSRVALKELDWSARICALTRPVSCVGKKPLGTIV
jgi:hypothetical protein